MADDYHRVDVKIDGEEKRVLMSRIDLKLALQSMWLDDMDNGWKLLEGRMPDLMVKAMDARDEKKEAERKKLMDELGVNKVHPLRGFIVRNWLWVTVFVVTIAVLRPDLRSAALSFIF